MVSSRTKRGMYNDGRAETAKLIALNEHIYKVLDLHAETVEDYIQLEKAYIELNKRYYTSENNFDVEKQLFFDLKVFQHSEIKKLEEKHHELEEILKHEKNAGHSNKQQGEDYNEIRLV